MPAVLVYGISSRVRALEAPQDPQTPNPGGQGPSGKRGQDKQPGDEAGDAIRPAPKARTKSAAPKKSRRSSGKNAAAADRPKTATGDNSAANAAPAGAISFKNDVAPILVANCVDCHSQGRPGLVRGKLDLTSFAKLMEGTSKEKVIEPGKPDDSHLVLRVKR